MINFVFLLSITQAFTNCWASDPIRQLSVGKKDYQKEDQNTCPPSFMREEKKEQTIGGGETICVKKPDQSDSSIEDSSRFTYHRIEHNVPVIEHKRVYQHIPVVNEFQIQHNVPVSRMVAVPKTNSMHVQTGEVLPTPPLPIEKEILNQQITFKSGLENQEKNLNHKDSINTSVRNAKEIEKIRSDLISENGLESEPSSMALRKVDEKVKSEFSMKSKNSPLANVNFIFDEKTSILKNMNIGEVQRHKDEYIKNVAESFDRGVTVVEKTKMNYEHDTKGEMTKHDENLFLKDSLPPLPRGSFTNPPTEDNVGKEDMSKKLSLKISKPRSLKMQMNSLNHLVKENSSFDEETYFQIGGIKWIDRLQGYLAIIEIKSGSNASTTLYMTILDLEFDESGDAMMNERLGSIVGGKKLSTFIDEVPLQVQRDGDIDGIKILSDANNIYILFTTEKGRRLHLFYTNEAFGWTYKEFETLYNVPLANYSPALLVPDEILIVCNDPKNTKITKIICNIAEGVCTRTLNSSYKGKIEPLDMKNISMPEYKWQTKVSMATPFTRYHQTDFYVGLAIDSSNNLFIVIMRLQDGNPEIVHIGASMEIAWPRLNRNEFPYSGLFYPKRQEIVRNKYKNTIFPISSIELENNDETRVIFTSIWGESSVIRVKGIKTLVQNVINIWGK